ncbi:MAG: hypothetical protein JGK01_29885 [Microcoleus sp. PH2017_03_ELD_O_A]|uniref:hypothetical protein n=1 Tax=unclassified Microcoleus TaxID=2642155 RepID=UPI001D25C91F|nr:MULTISPECIES: hypothetical protein [unclassified Microcoleus]MCC3445771.1 hypothetical protein [Microcoleus sp. PH2017_03_ELD_O_A]MCC3501949.1 hypothetical protein [Microcoleus sp. PH2017_19_SFW_U_A]MCC3508771.1 hypothetical protein [Microcoleus sp. PH2017_17_BER_D_A]MCC3520201.1 hypothetical protein [Microcoleus sp. PH2017_20_SFW_D_A]MCC3545165.1 hypothetical protein [Microcoleus sp. PH2017_24_DOB_U_A]MCC3563882.1 hypothetical protein [Microcoleus sp. PH2017_31_RDM_U_A]MCC3584744.1 hypot
MSDLPRFIERIRWSVGQLVSSQLSINCQLSIVNYQLNEEPIFWYNFGVLVDRPTSNRSRRQKP